MIGLAYITTLPTSTFARDVSSVAANVLILDLNHFREPGYTHQRKVAAWIGGSIIGSMETYKVRKSPKNLLGMLVVVI